MSKEGVFFKVNKEKIPVGKVDSIIPKRGRPFSDNIPGPYETMSVIIKLNMGVSKKFIYYNKTYYYLNISSVCSEAICSDSFLVFPVPVLYCCPFITTTDVKIFL